MVVGFKNLSGKPVVVRAERHHTDQFVDDPILNGSTSDFDVPIDPFLSETITVHVYRQGGKADRQASMLISLSGPEPECDSSEVHVIATTTEQ